MRGRKGGRRRKQEISKEEHNIDEITEEELSFKKEQETKVK